MFKRGEPLPADFQQQLRRQQIIDEDFADMDSRSGSVFAFLILYMVSIGIGAGFMYMLFKAGILNC